MEEKPNYQEGFDKAFQNFLEIYIRPEVERRQAKGELPTPFELRAAQIIFPVDGKKIEIRLNSEFIAIAQLKLKKGVNKNAGDPIFENEVDGISELTLSDKDDPNNGHVEMLMLNNQWFLIFDFLYDKALSLKHINAAKQFIEAAEGSLEKEIWSPFIDNLFSATELLAKAKLLGIWSDPKFRINSNHKAVHSRYNQMANMRNVSSEYAQTFNKLSKLRYLARYVEGDITMSEEEAIGHLNVIKRMLKDTEEFYIRYSHPTNI